MSEMEGFAAALAPVSEFSPSAPSPGSLLRHAREVAGVHMATLAGILKVSTEKLEALESDDFSALPNAAFARALTCSICRILQIDSAPILELMPKSGLHDWSSAQSSIDAAFKDGSERSARHPLWTLVTRPVTLAVMALLIGAVIVVLLPDKAETPKDVAGSLEQEALQMQHGAAMASLDGDAAPAPSVSVSEQAIGVAPSPVPELLPQLLTIAPMSPAPETTPSVNSAAVSVSPNDLLAFRARDGSWVQVKEASGSVVFQRTLTKGEVVSVSGVPPLTVVVGRADSTEVFVRGAVFDLSGVARENVARFEVSP